LLNKEIGSGWLLRSLRAGSFRSSGRSRKHAGMMDFGLQIFSTQQAAGNEPEEIQKATA
jgi:hypothetical protein